MRINGTVFSLLIVSMSFDHQLFSSSSVFPDQHDCFPCCFRNKQAYALILGAAKKHTATWGDSGVRLVACFKEFLGLPERQRCVQEQTQHDYNGSIQVA